MSSRVSSKSSLSPSGTQGSNRIDLGKDSGVDMGRKSQVSTSSGGIGVTTEVMNVGGLSVTGGVSVDVSPLGFDVSADPTKGEVSIAASAEIPGGIVGVGGGVTVDTAGQIKGGSISGEIVGIGVEVSRDEDGNIGLGVSWQIPFTPITINLGIGQEKEEKKPIPTPSPQARRLGYELSELNIDSRKLYSALTLDVGFVQILTFSQDFTKRVISAFNPPRALWVSNGFLISQLTMFGNNLLNYNFKQHLVGKVDGRWIQTAASVLDAETDLGGDGVFNPFPAATFSYNNKVEGNTLRKQHPYFNNLGIVSGWSVVDYVRRWQANSPILLSLIEIPATAEEIPKLLTPNGSVPLDEESNSDNADPPPNPPPRKEMDECCRTSIKLLRAIYKGLGIQKFPGQLPSTIIQEVSEEGATPAEPPQEPIADFADLLMWQFARDDERWGQWQVQINIKDSDLTQKGDQGKQVKLPNLAESIAEIEGQMLSVVANVEALVALQTRTLCESGMARQEAIKAYLASLAIAQYMNFPYEEADIEIPATFTPGVESIHDLIKESTIHVKGIEYKSKETQRDILLDLLQAAAITRAVHWRQVDPKKDIKSQILENLQGSANLSDKLNDPIKGADKSDKSKHTRDWEDFLDQVEDGFGFEAGIENAQTPYGRNRDRRPRIRQIGENIDQAGKANG